MLVYVLTASGINLQQDSAREPARQSFSPASPAAGSCACDVLEFVLYAAEPPSMRRLCMSDWSRKAPTSTGMTCVLVHGVVSTTKPSVTQATASWTMCRLQALLHVCVVFLVCVCVFFGGGFALVCSHVCWFVCIATSRFCPLRTNLVLCGNTWFRLLTPKPLMPRSSPSRHRNRDSPHVNRVLYRVIMLARLPLSSEPLSVPNATRVARL